MRRRRPWSPTAVARLMRDYANSPTWKIARAVKRPLYSVYGKAAALGLQKSPEYLAGPHACRLRRGDDVGIAFRFPPGHIPANKGLRRPGWHAGRMRETQFKKGQRIWHQRNVGDVRLADGYLYIKIADVPRVPWTRNWLLLHIFEWERANGRPIPEGHCLRFRDGNRLNTAPDNLELITRRENALRNVMHRFPEPLRRAIHAKAALVRKIHNLEKQHGKDT